jgi:hypothetical protein
MDEISCLDYFRYYHYNEVFYNNKDFHVFLIIIKGILKGNNEIIIS